MSDWWCIILVEISKLFYKPAAILHQSYPGFFFFFVRSAFLIFLLFFQWNEVTRLFRAGMPLRKHRQNFRHHASCFTASAAVDWLHQLLCSNSNFGPEVTRQQTVQLLKKFLKNHVIEDVKGRWGSEDLEDNNTLYRSAKFCRSCTGHYSLGGAGRSEGDGPSSKGIDHIHSSKVFLLLFKGSRLLLPWSPFLLQRRPPDPWGKGLPSLTKKVSLNLRVQRNKKRKHRCVYLSTNVIYL